MAPGSLRRELADLVGGLAGWRLEPQTTPGASPLWCFVADGKVEYSVTVDGPAIALYVMETDGEIAFSGRDAFVAWLVEHRPDALRPAPTRADKKKKVRKFFEWG